MEAAWTASKSHGERCEADVKIILITFEPELHRAEVVRELYDGNLSTVEASSSRIELPRENRMMYHGRPLEKVMIGSSFRNSLPEEFAVTQNNAMIALETVDDDVNI